MITQFYLIIYVVFYVSCISAEGYTNNCKSDEIQQITTPFDGTCNKNDKHCKEFIFTSENLHDLEKQVAEFAENSIFQTPNHQKPTASTLSPPEQLTSASANTDCPGSIYHFPNDNQTTDYVIVNMIQNIPEIEELSVCAWLTPLPGKRLSGAVYSYFMSESFNGNGFLIFFNDNAPFNLEVYVNYEKRETLPTFENIFFYKSHICLLVSTKNNVVSLYVNGSFVMTEGFHVDKKPIRGNGKVILGQEQDQDEGGFQASQAFSGTIKNLIVWDHKISKKKIEHLYKTQCICPQDYVMVPTQNAVKIHGNVKANYITQC